MKAIVIDYEYYMFPEGMDSIGVFIEYLNNHPNTFIKLKQYSEERCKGPYFIREDVKEVFINVANITKVEMKEIYLLSNNEYEERLKDVIKEKCLSCERYRDDDQPDDLETYRDKLSLDGDCFGYDRKE